MACCVVIALVLGLVPRLWARVRGRSASDALFAPVAYRPPPGTVLKEVPSKSSAGRPLLAGLLAWSSAGVVLYMGALVAMLWTGVAQSPGSTPTWLFRTSIISLAAFAALRLSRRNAPDHTQSNRAQTSYALIAGGLAWSVLGVVDMHVFGLIDIAHGSGTADLIFHGVGPLASLLGVALLPSSVLAEPRRKPVNLTPATVSEA